MINIKLKYLFWIAKIEISCVETIFIVMCKQISSNSFKNKITYKLFTHEIGITI